MAAIVDIASRRPVASQSEYRKVPPGRPHNADVREREYLTPAEVDAMMKAAGQIGRNRHRDKTLILTAYRHALRVSELVALKWSQIDLQAARIHVNRRKNGEASVHPLTGGEVRALRKLKRESEQSAFVFTSERGGTLTTDTVRKLVARAGREAGIPFPVHPHMLRHAAGYKLVNDNQPLRAIQQFLGHKQIRHTTAYTKLADGQFESFWQD